MAANRKVLVVDDDATTVELVRLYLNRDGYRVLTANNGIEALRLARESHPDLVVLDLMLPGMDGMNCLHALISIDRNVKVIISSGYSSDGDKEEALKSGAVSFLKKPYTIHELLRITKKTLDEPALSRSYET